MDENNIAAIEATVDILFLRLVTRGLVKRARVARLERVKTDLAKAYEHPLDFAYDPYREFPWPENRIRGFSLEHLTIKVPYRRNTFLHLAYIQNWMIDRDRGDGRRMATIGHIATESDNVRRGLGSALARTLFRELNARYGVTRIEFRETASEATAHLYPGFFRRLGSIEIIPNDSNKSYWIWDYVDIDRIEDRD